MKRDRLYAFTGLTAIVQYRRKSGDFDPWHNMAAFDSKDMAERYALSCANETWEYDVIEAPEEDAQ